MLGYEISWAAFNVIEVMSSVKFTHKVSFMVLFFLYVLLLYILPVLHVVTTNLRQGMRAHILSVDDQSALNYLASRLM